MQLGVQKTALIASILLASALFADDTKPLIGLKLENVGELKPDHEAFQAIYNRAMQDLPLTMRPSLTTIHCNTADMSMFSVRVTVGDGEDHIWLSQADEWQFANSASLEVFMRKHNRDVKDLAERSHRAGQRTKKKQ